MSNEYLSNPPVATSGQLLAISESISQLQRSMDRMSDMPQKVDRIEIATKQIEKDMQQTREGFQADLNHIKATFKDELNRIREDSDSRFKAVFDEVKDGRKETDLQIRILNESKAKTDTIGKIVYIGGPILVASVLGAWGSLSGKTDTANTQSASNAQALVVLQKEQDQTSRTLDEIRIKLYERNYMSDQK